MKRIVLVLPIMCFCLNAFCCAPEFLPSYLEPDMEEIEGTYRSSLRLEVELKLIMRGSHAKGLPVLYVLPPVGISDPRAAAHADLKAFLGPRASLATPGSKLYKYCVRTPVKKLAGFALAPVDSNPDAVLAKRLPSIFKYLDAPTIDHFSALAALYDKARIAALAGGDVPDLSSGNKALAEFRLYLEGVSEMKRDADANGGRARNVPSSWLRLLALPPEERKYNSARALYMIGNLHASNGRIAEAHATYKRLRDAVASNLFSDSEGLASASFKKDYQCETDPVLKLKAGLAAFAYYVKADFGVSNRARFMLDELRIRCDYSLYTPAQLSVFLDDPLCRELFCAVESSIYERPQFIKLLGGRQTESCARIAFIAYKSGENALAKEWLARTPDTSLLKHWTAAKISRSEGKWKEAAEHLKKWLATFDGTDVNTTSEIVRLKLCGGCSGYFEKPVRDDVLSSIGEAAAHLMGFNEAMHCFLAGDDWVDASFVAERLISVEDLQKYVELHCAVGTDVPLMPIHASLRHLLARRLMRLERYQEALEFMPPEHKDFAREFGDHLVLSQDKRLSRDLRALHLFNAAKIARWRGMELFGTEHAPDSFIAEGRYTFSLSYPSFLTAAKDKMRLQIYQASAVNPNKRFHYRYKAAELMARAAALAESPSLKAASLLAGGFFLKLRDPKAANPFYLKLAAMKEDIDIVNEAKLAHWFPACPDFESKLASLEALSLDRIQSEPVLEVNGNL